MLLYGDLMFGALRESNGRGKNSAIDSSDVMRVLAGGQPHGVNGGLEN
jgi:hypothetical protein